MYAVFLSEPPLTYLVYIFWEVWLEYFHGPTSGLPVSLTIIWWACERRGCKILFLVFQGLIAYRITTPITVTHSESMIFFVLFYFRVRLSSMHAPPEFKTSNSCFKYKDISGLIIKFLTRVFYHFLDQYSEISKAFVLHNMIQLKHWALVLLRKRIC